MSKQAKTTETPAAILRRIELGCQVEEQLAKITASNARPLRITNQRTIEARTNTGGKNNDNDGTFTRTFNG